MAKKTIAKSSRAENLDVMSEATVEMETPISRLVVADGLSKTEIYREAGYLYRHYCRSRIAVLSITLPIVFAVDLILLKDDDHWLHQLLMAFFGLCMFIIACKINNYYARRINIVKTKLLTLELSRETRVVHANIETLAEDDRKKVGFLREIFSRGDMFSTCVYFIGGAGIVLILALYPKWLENAKREIWSLQPKITEKVDSISP